MGLFSKYSKAKMKSKSFHSNSDAIKDNEVQSLLTKNIAVIDRLFSDTPDLVVRFLQIKYSGEQGALIYMEGLSDTDVINNNVLRPLLHDLGDSGSEDIPVEIGQVERGASWEDIEFAILEGKSVLFVDQKTEVTIFNTQGWPQRAVENPKMEASLKGAHQGLVETSSKNIALIRRYIRNSELKIKEHKVGIRGRTNVSILYLEDVANPEILHEMEKRIQNVNIDAIINTGELAELIEDNPYSPFPQLLISERPDIASAHILQGRLVIVVDGSPSAIIAPASFTTFFNSVDDYGTRWIIGSFIRLQRYIGVFIAMLLPAFYIAVSTYNYEIIPLKLLLSVGESRGRIPFPSLIEALIMELSIEMMREAGIRLPSPIGNTIGVVGGIIIGQAAVQAGIVSNIMVIIVALTAIASFILPSYDMASGIRLVRFPMMILASQLGFYGIMIGLFILIAHVISLESLGTPFGSPIAPMQFSDLKDSFIRFPLWKLNKRPSDSQAIQQDRMGKNRLEDNTNE